MDRRDFLRLASFATTAAVVRVPFWAGTAAAATKPVSANGLLYKTDGTGKIFVSATNGKTWTLQTNLGSMYAVSALAVDKAGRLLATVVFKGRSFGLKLATDKRSWMTT
jgi:photosystem II stability/assembly factor-like uncharacterized protein